MNNNLSIVKDIFKELPNNIEGTSSIRVNISVK